VALPGPLVPLLLEHKRSQAEQLEMLGGQSMDEALVPCTHEGKPLDPTTVSRALRN